MLEFFRKYQKSFFLLIAVVVISSFVFFGTFNAYHSGPEQVDRVVGRAIDGTKMHLLELQHLERLIAVDREETAAIGGFSAPNLFNDGVIRNDFLRTGAAEVMVRSGWEMLRGEMGEKLDRVKKFRAYEHPGAPFLGAKAVWERFSPAINREWSELQAAEEVSADTFEHLARLYFLQKGVPAEWLRQILLLQEQQYQWLQPDPRLRQDDLSLFGFHTASDWFGKRFVELAAQFLHNAAIEASEKGYVVSLAEAKASLRSNFASSVQKLKEAKRPVELTYRQQLQVLGMSEREAAQAWRKVLLVRRYFNDVSEAAYLDRLPYSEFASVAAEKALVDIYQWPKSLELQSSLDLLGLQTYVQLVSKDQLKDPLALPESFASADEVAKRAPELVYTQYTAQVCAIDKREASLNAPLKDVWDFETSEEGWKALKKEFPFIQQLNGRSEEERFQSLETINPVNRGKIDLFARRTLLNKHSEWVDQALEKCEKKQRDLRLSVGEIKMDHIENSRLLGSLFEQILSKPEEALSALQRFDSGDAVFRFDNIAKVSDPKIKTFEEAKKDGSISTLLDRALESEFPKVKAKLPAEKQTLSWSDLKEEIAEQMLLDVKKRLLKLAPNEDVHFSSYRLVQPAERAMKSIQQGETNWIRQDGADPLANQFKMEKAEREITRTTQEEWMGPDIFVLMPKEWSPIKVAANGMVHFAYVKDRLKSEEPILEQLSFGKALLVSDVQRILAQKVMDRIANQHSAVVPLQPEQE